jgi:choline dehydrogenase-like flavoprotein
MTARHASTDFDAIVIGSGITGGWAAKELTEAGLKVLVLERGREVEHGRDYPTEHAAPWNMPFRGEGNPARYRAEYPIQSTHFLFNEYAEHFFVKDSEHPYLSDPEHPFKWFRGYQVGGRSLIWGRQCNRWSDLDFGANARDGHGADWPLRYRDLAPWYDRVEEFIGVSGDPIGLPQLPDGPYLPAMALNCGEQVFKERVEAAFPDRAVTIGRVAVLTRPHRGRGACHYCGPCERGCSVGAYFSSQSATLPAARATGRLTLLPHRLVERIAYDPARRRAVAVEVIDASTRARSRYSARLIFVCASTLGTTQILLNSRSETFPRGLGNSSGVLGRYLMDQGYSSSLVARIPGLEDRYYYGNRPNTLYVPRFHNLGARPDRPFLRGYALQGRAWRPGWQRGKVLPGFGAAFKDALRRPGPWMLVLVGSAECLPRADNFVELDEQRPDRWGIPQLRIHFRFGDNEKLLAEDARSEALAMAKAAGLEVLRASGELMPPGSAIHEMGTARMGRDPNTSVLNGYNQMHDVANVFVSDGACMASSACQNPSLTYMALTARACQYAVEQFRAETI